MSLRDGIEISSYDELIKMQNPGLLFETNGDRAFFYNTTFNCPGMVNIETGERFYSEDIQRYIRFPLHRVKLTALTQDDLNAT